MFKRILCVSVVFVLAGCTSPLKRSVYEVLQVPSSTRLYLSSNHWYNDPLKMDSFNYQNGSILPFGTEVTDFDFDETYIAFKRVKDGRVFGITLNKNYAMISMDKYIKQILMVKNPAEVELDTKPTVFEKIVRGVVEKGMTKEEVIMAYGVPSRHRTPEFKSDTWIYQESRTQTRRVVFKKGIVTAVLNY